MIPDSMTRPPATANATATSGTSGNSGGSATRDSAAVVARVVAAGITVPRAESVLVDLANDPPLGGSASTIAVEEGERIVTGLGAAMLASRARRGRIALREPRAKRSLDALLAALEAKQVDVVRVPERWPSLGL